MQCPTSSARIARRLAVTAAALWLATPAMLCAAESVPVEPFHVSPDLRELEQVPRIMLIIFQVAAILAAAKLLGWLSEKVKIPGVIGELMAGVIIGPFLLGHLIQIPMHGHWIPLFPHPTAAGQWPVNDVIWSLAQFASIILLFVTGLHTNLSQFLKYVGPATLIAFLGLIVPFALGVGVVYIPMFSEIARGGPGEPTLVPALFVGAILAATSIGITARVLGDIGKLDTSEGVTIIGAAVLDDVLGIIALAIVGGIAATGTVSAGSVSFIAFKAVGFWVALTAGILLLSNRIERWIRKIKYAGAMVGLALALAFICSGAAEGFGLAFIIGAYSVGLGLSRTKMAHELMDELRPIYDFIVPIFFAALGMLVDFNAMLSDWRVIVFGLVVTAVAIIGKVVGCGGAALTTGFNNRGAWRIGLGMMPRGEVALIVAGIGLSRKIIQEDVFGVSIMMTLLTTVIAPIMLVPAFRKGGSGRRKPEMTTADLPAVSMVPGVQLTIPDDMGELMLNRLLAMAQAGGWVGTFDQAAQETYVLRNGGDAVEIRMVDGVLFVDASGTRQGDFNSMLEQVRQSVLADAGGAAAQDVVEPTSS